MHAPPSCEESQVPNTARDSSANAVPTPGREGARDKYVRELIRRWAEAHGWRVSTEERAFGELGPAVVALQKGEHVVACEIWVTTLPECEIANIQKGLAAKCWQVVFVSTDKRVLLRARRFIAALPDPQRERVHCETPDGLFALLETLDAAARTDEDFRGYRVRVRYRRATNQDAVTRRQAIARIMADATRRLARIEQVKF